MSISAAGLRGACRPAGHALVDPSDGVQADRLPSAGNPSGARAVPVPSLFQLRL